MQTRFLLIGLAFFASSLGCAGIDARRAFLDGQRLEKEGALDRAVESYRLAAREAPNPEHAAALERAETALFRALVQRAKRAEADNEFESAADHWKALERLRPEDARIRARRRIAQLRHNGNSDELWAASLRLLELAPGNREVVRVVAEIQTRVLEDSLAEAWVSIRAGERGRAFDAFERVAKIDPRHPDLARPEARRVISETLEEKGDALAASGQWDEARALYLRAHAAVPRPDLEQKRQKLDEEADAERRRLSRARALRSHGRFVDALAEYERLLPPAPESPLFREIQETRTEVEARRRRSAEKLLVRGEVERALHTLEKSQGSIGGLSFESRKRAVEILLEEARSAGHAGEDARTAGRLKRALELAEPPPSLSAVLHAGIRELEQGAEDAALARFAEARSLEPRSKLAVVGHEVSLGLLVRRKMEEGRALSAKDPHQAYLAFRAAAGLDPESPHAANAVERLRPRVTRTLIQRAFAYEAEGRFGHAFVLVERALEIVPEDEEARHARQRLAQVLAEPHPPVLRLITIPESDSSTPCGEVGKAWEARLVLYLSRARRLPFVLEREGTEPLLELRSTIERCEIDASGGQLTVRLAFETDGVGLAEFVLDASLPPLAKGKATTARVLAQRDELVTRAAAKVVRGLRPHRADIGRWAEARARARLEGGEAEPVALAYAALRLAPDRSRPAGDLMARLEAWLGEHLQ